MSSLELALTIAQFVAAVAVAMNALYQFGLRIGWWKRRKL